MKNFKEINNLSGTDFITEEQFMSRFERQVGSITIEAQGKEKTRILHIFPQKLRSVPKGFDMDLNFPYVYIAGDNGWIVNCPVEGKLEIYWSQE